MDDQSLGHLDKIDLRTVWESESEDFTPWLARPENLEYLAETLGLELELEAQEKFVGPFRADILCRDVGTDSWVLIENQLEKTDHRHLGQLLTYAAGLQAVTIVWVAESFTDEHRASLDWLNNITDKDFRFFGLEVELWRIGDSLPAPKFNIVSKPNDWSRSVARAVEEGELSETKLTQKEYWTVFHLVLQNTKGPISADRTPLPQSWMEYRIGRSGFQLLAVRVPRKKRVRAELNIYSDQAKAYFRLLERQKDEVEKDLGYELEWEELPENKKSRIWVCLDDVDPGDRSDWPRQHKWLAEKMNEMHRVFHDRIKELDCDDLMREED